MMKSNYNRIIPIFGLIFIAVFLYGNFASAQSTPAADVVTIPPAALKNAQTSPEACKKFRADVQIIWPGQAKAIWSSEVIPGDETATVFRACSIVPANYPDFLDAALTKPSGNDPNGLYGTTDQIPQEFKNIQTQIGAGVGVSSDKVAAASAKAKTEQVSAGPLSIFIAWVLVPIFTVINSVLAGIAALAGGIFNQAVYPILHITAMPTVVVTGWTIVRDICNMFFILALIVMALATILQIGDQYNYKRLLPKLVISALLVNFSMVISVTIMNAVNFLAAVFWSGPNVELNHLFAIMMKIANPVGDIHIIWTGGALAELALGLGRMLFTIVATAVFIALAGLFVIRLVGLYVLIIFSPVAFVANILPATKKYSDNWWSYFLKYLIWAPVALFMLRLTMVSVDNNSQFNFSGGGDHDSVFVFFILSAFMAAALLLAQQAGMVGSAMVINGVRSGMKGIGGMAYGATDRKLASWAGKGGVRGALSYASLGAFKQGRKMALHHKEEESYTVAAGIRADQYRRALGGGKGDFERLARYQRVAQEAKRYENITDKGEKIEQTVHAYNEVMKGNTGEADKFFGGLSKLAASGDYNEMAFALGDKTASAANVQKIVKDLVEKTGNKNYYRIAADITSIAEKEGDWWVAGAFKNKGGGEYGIRENEEERTIYVANNQAKLSDQSKIRNFNRRSLGFNEKMETLKDNEGNVLKDENGKEKTVWVNVGIDEPGKIYAARLTDIEGWRNNGNKDAKANVAINGSAEWLAANPQAWAVAANDHARLALDTSDRGKKAFEIYKSTVAAPAIDSEGKAIYTTKKTVRPSQARQFMETHKEELKDPKEQERYKYLIQYAALPDEPETSAPASSSGSPTARPTNPSGSSSAFTEHQA